MYTQKVVFNVSAVQYLLFIALLVVLFIFIIYILTRVLSELNAKYENKTYIINNKEYKIREVKNEKESGKFIREEDEMKEKKG